MSASLKIAFYTDTYKPSVDGVVTSIVNFKKELERRGHEVYIFTSGDPNSRFITKEKGNVYIVRGIKFKNYPQYTLAAFPFLTHFNVNKLGIDIIHAQTPFMMGFSSMVIARTNRIPLVSTFHTFFTEKSVIREYASKNRYMRRLFTKYAWPYAKFFYNRCNGVVAPSESVKRVLIKHSIKNVTVVPNSVDLKRFNPDVDGSALRKRLLGSSYRKMVLYTGRMSKEKKIDTMIKAAKHMKNRDVRFVMVGTGPFESHYKSMVKRMGMSDRFVFEGYVTDSMLPKYYAASDLFCMPSTFETQGIVSLEALASGKPVVAADYLALSDLIESGRNGEKFRPGDSINCARKIEKVINNTDAYKVTDQVAKEYSISKTTDRLLDFYKKSMSDEYAHSANKWQFKSKRRSKVKAIDW